jgi:hypothetical protein
MLCLIVQHVTWSVFIIIYFSNFVSHFITGDDAVYLFRSSFSSFQTSFSSASLKSRCAPLYGSKLANVLHELRQTELCQ